MLGTWIAAERFAPAAENKVLPHAPQTAQGMDGSLKCCLISEHLSSSASPREVL